MFSLRDKRLFVISEVEITGVNCIHEVTQESVRSSNRNVGAERGNNEIVIAKEDSNLHYSNYLQKCNFAQQSYIMDVLDQRRTAT